MDIDDRRRDANAMMEDFYNGSPMLQKLADWAYINANHHEILRHLSLFETAYEQLVELNSLGKLSAGRGDFSAENLELVRRINRLIQTGLDSNEARESAKEIHTLVQQLLNAITRTGASPAGVHSR